jgi:7-carboxy-7-deazaguanine synthase
MPAPNTVDVNEIFYSIQGEGRWTGTAMVFVRLAGCTMGCDFCDTKYSWGDGFKLTVAEVLEEVKGYPCNRVCITGGEPLEQNLTELTGVLKDAGYMIHLETNGAHLIVGVFDWVVLSPKKHVIQENFPMASEVKCVITCADDLKKYAPLAQNVHSLVFVPVSNDPEIARLVIEFVKANPEVHLGWQLQKTIAMR